MKVTYNKIEYDCNDLFSYRDFGGKNAKHHYENISDGIIIYGSCFSQEIPDLHIFPDNLTGVTFIKSNLDNVYIPVGNTVIDCRQRRFKVQNDLNDWLIDVSNIPTMPINYKMFTKMGLPMPKPMDIPLVKVDEVVDLVKVAEVKKLEIV